VKRENKRSRETAAGSAERVPRRKREEKRQEKREEHFDGFRLVRSARGRQGSIRFENSQEEATEGYGLRTVKRKPEKCMV